MPKDYPSPITKWSGVSKSVSLITKKSGFQLVKMVNSLIVE